MARNLHAEITARILAKLEAGVAPWRQSWSSKGTGAMPRNAITGRAYSGANVPLLWIAQQENAYESARWLTFKQALEAGGSVRKGERGSQIIFVSTIEREDEETGKLRRIPFLKAYTVFNVAQCDGLPAGLQPVAVAVNPGQRDELAQEFLASTGAEIRHGEGRAYYRRDLDFINLPAFETFVSSDAYYGTAFHELAHWTGADRRLNRTKGKRFGDQEYTYEELVAELSAAFLSAEFGFDNDDDAASYLACWIKFLKDHETAFVAAASDASKAVTYLRGLALAEPADAEERAAEEVAAPALPVAARTVAAAPIVLLAETAEERARRLNAALGALQGRRRQARAVQDFDMSALPLFGDQSRQIDLFAPRG